MEHVGFLSDGDCQEPAVRRLHLPLPKFNVDPDVTTLDRYGSTRAPSIHLLSISTAVLFCCSSRPYYSAADSIVRHASMEDFRTSCHGNPRRWRCMWSPEIIRYQQRNDNQWVHSQTLQKKNILRLSSPSPSPSLSLDNRVENVLLPLSETSQSLVCERSLWQLLAR